MKRQSQFRIFLLAAMAYIPAAANALIIDTFDEGAISLTANAANPMVQGVATGSGIIGGERDITVSYYAPGSNALDGIDMRVDFLNQNNVSHSQDAGVAGISTFVYDGTDGSASTTNFSGLGGVDLTTGNADAFLLSVLFADQGVNNVLNVRVYSSATAYSDIFYSFMTPVNSATPVTLLFSNFAVGSGASSAADFTNVNAILLAVDGRSEPALDVRIDFFGTNENPVIPEPATLGLFGLGLTGVGLLRRRAQRAKR